MAASDTKVELVEKIGKGEIWKYTFDTGFVGYGAVMGKRESKVPITLERAREWIQTESERKFGSYGRELKSLREKHRSDSKD